MNRFYFFIALCTILCASTLQAQVGTEFWLAPPEATSGHVTDEPILLRIATGDVAATVTISMPAEPLFNGGSDIVINVAANSAASQDLSPHKELLETKPMDAVLNTGLKITSDAPITVYYEINTGFNPDIWALKGPNSLGTEFYAPFQQRWRNGNYSPVPWTSFDIVATEDNTTVLIFPSKNLFGGRPAFQSYTVTLNEGQTYSGGVISTVGADNPSGSIILSDKPIAVSTKDDSVWPQPAGCRDMNGDQLVPVNIVGREYIVVKGGLTINEYAYVTATQNNTTVFVDGVQVATLFNGETYEILVNAPTKFIETSKPSYVIHMSGFGCETGTALLPPLNCAGSEQVFFTRSSTETFILTILVPTGAEDAFELNGNTTLIQASDFSVVPGTNGEWQFMYKTFPTGQIPINTAQLLTNSEEVFSLGIINGGASSGCRYGYFSEFSSEIIVDAGANQVVCANDTVQLGGIVEGGATLGVWSSSGTGTFIPDASDLNAQYLFSIDDIANTTVTLTLTSVGNCFPVEDEMIVTIPPAPLVNAGSDIEACENNPAINLNGSVIFAGGGQWSGGSGSFNPNNTTLNATYTPTPAEISNGNITLTLTSIGNGTCFPEEDEVVITFTDAPEVNAGPDQTYCANNAAVILNGSVINAGGGTWSGGGGSFDPSPNALNVTYFPSAAELATGSVNLTLTTTINGNCLAESDNVQITFTPAPVANAGTNQFVCSNNAAVTLNGAVSIATGGTWSGGLGSFVPNNNTLNATYSPAASEIANGQVTLTLTTTGNGTCLAVSDEMTINIGPGPVVDAGPNQTLCANNPVASLSGSIINAGGGIWSGGSGAFSPGTTSLNATYTPTPAEITAGSVTLTLTSTGNGNCVAESDQIILNFTPAPTANAGADQSVCANNPNVQLAGSFTVAGGAQWSGGLGTFTPGPTAVNAIYTPSAGEIILGSVTLTLTTTSNGNCNAVNDAMTITITPSPEVDAGSNIDVCANNPSATLNGSVTVASGGLWTGGLGTFTPDNSALDAVYTPTANEINNGSVTLTLTSTGNGNCTAVNDQVTINIGPSPIVDAGTNQTVCANNPGVNLNGNVLNAGGGTWSGGSGTFFPNANTLNAQYTPSAAEITAGTVSLTLTSTGNGLCNAVTDAMTITITPAPVVNAGPNISVCANNSAVTLNGSVSVASGGVWSGGNGSFDPAPNALNVIYSPTAAEIASGSLTLTLTSTGNGNCNSVSDQMTITFTPSPTANAGSNVSVCANNVDVALNGAVTVATGGSWSGGLGIFNPNANTLNATYTPTASEIANGSVTLTLTTTGNGGCNAVSDAMTINISPAPVVSAGPAQTACANNATITLNGTVSNAGGGTWSGGNGTYFPGPNSLSVAYTPTATEIASGSITLTLTSTGNGLCNAESAQTTITYTPAPVVNAGSDASYCANNAVVILNGSVTGAGGGTWSGGSGTFDPSANALNVTYFPTAAELSLGSITLTLTSTGNGNCNPVSDSKIVTFTPAPTADAGFNAFVCANNANVSLNGSVTVATGGNWSGGLGVFTPNNTALNAVYTPSASEINAGTVTLTLTTTGNANCAPVSDQMTITIGPGPIVNAGANQVACQNNPAATIAGSVTNAGGGIWSGGNGTFTPSASSLIAIYTPTGAEAASGSVTLTLTSTGNGNCLPETDEVTITYTPSPTANAGADQDLCTNNPVATLNGSVTVASGGTWSGGLGIFTPNSNTLNATYTPTAGELAAGFVELTLTTTGNGDCNPVNDQVILNYTPSPTANAGADIEACSNNPEFTLNGSVTIATGGSWSGGLGIFTPSASDLNAVYTPTQSEINAGALTLTLTTTGNGNCIAVTDQVDITFTPSPTANAGANFSVCSNNPDLALGGSVTVATGGTWSGGAGSFSPNANVLNAVYTPTATEISNGNITLTLTTTGNGDCLAVNDEVTVSFTPSPTANAGSDQSVCDNTPDVVLNGSVTVATGGTWSGGGGTFSPNANTLNATYTPSAGEIAAGTATLTLTTTGNGNCNPENDIMTITINEGPQVDAGVDADVCSNNATIALSGTVQFAGGGVWTGGLGLFSPNASALNATYTPTAGEIASGNITLTLTTTGNGSCLPSADEVTYTFTPAPTISAGSDRIVCANNVEVDLDGSVTVAGGAVWSGGNGAFDPDANTLNANYTPTAAEILNGAVVLTLTSVNNGNCNPVSDQMNIIITQAPIANAGSDQTVCANNVEVSLNGAVFIATGGVWSGGTGTFIPNANTLNATYTPSSDEIANGGVVLTLTTTGNGLCFAETDEMEINITPAPVVDAGGDQTLCSNNATVNLGGSVSIASGGQWTGGLGSFSPNSTDLNAVYTPTQSEINAGTLTLTLTSTGNGLCLPESDELTITFTPTPVVDAGANQTVCANNSEVDLTGSVSVATGGTWSGGNGTFTPDANTLNATYTPSAAEATAGTVTLTLTSTGNGNCIPVADEMTITITPAPMANAGSNQTVCANAPNVTLNGSVSVATGGTWSGGNGIFNPDANTLNAVYTPTAAEITNGGVTLTLTTTGNGNCVAITSTINITITPAPLVNAGPDQTLCNNNAVAQLNGNVTIASGGQWSGGLGTFTPGSSALNAQYTPSSAELISGSVTLTLTSTGNGNCLAVTDEITITYTDAPTVDAGLNLNSCANNPTVTLNGFVSAEATGGEWSGGTGNFAPNNFNLSANYTPSAAEISAGSVTLTLTSVGNGNCLPVSDEVTINIAPAPTANAGADQTVCSNNSLVTLNGSVTGANGGVWTGGDGTFNPSATALNATYEPTPGELSAGNVSLTLTTTGIGSCNAVSDVMNINFTLSPTANAGADQAACENNSTVTLNGSVTVATGGSWTGGLGTFSPNNNTLNATYTPTQGEIAGGSVTLTLITTGNGNCLAVSDQMTITYSQAPTVDAGPNQTVCSNNAQLSLSGQVFGATGGVWSGGSGTFFPNAFNLNATYNPTPAEIASGSLTLTLTSAGNGNCNAVTDVMTITFSPSPTANAGADANICSNNSTITLGGSVTVASGGAWSGGAGTFSPDNTVLNATYTPTGGELAGGSVTLTLTTTGNGSCNAVNDVVTYTFTPSPTADAGANQSICSNNPDISLNGSVTVATGGQWSGGLGSFTPNSTDLNAVYTPTQSEINSGSLTLTLTTTGNGNCTPVTDNITITFTPAPTAEAGSNINVCANNSAATLNGSVTTATGGTWSGGTGSFVPNANALNATYTPSATEVTNGSVILTLTTTGNGNCIAATDVVTINIAPAPIVSAGSDHEVCANNPNLTLNGSVSNAGGGIWSGGNGSFSPSNTSLGAVYTPAATEIASGSVQLTLTSTGNGSCLAESDVVNITITPAPVVNAGPDQTLCQNNATAQLAASITVASGGQWSGGSGSFSPSSTNLNATYTPSVSELVSGSVTLTLTSTGNGNCVSESDQVTLFFTPAPTVEAGSNFSVCSNNADFQLNGMVTVAAGGEWSGGAGTFSPNNFTLNANYSPTPEEIASGSLTLTLTSSGNGNCTEVTDQVTITFTPSPVANAGADLVSCENNPTVTLLGSVSNAGGGIWTGGNGTFDPANTSVGADYTPTPAEILSGSVTLTLTTTGVGNCNPVSDQMTITFTDSPIVEAGPNQNICSNNTATVLNGSVTNAGGGTWTGGGGTFSPSTSTLNATYTPTSTEVSNGSVTLTLTSTGNGTCLAESDVMTIVFTASPTADAGPNQTVCSNNPATDLNGIVTIASGGTWSGGNGTFSPNANALDATYIPTATEISSGQVTLTLTTTGNGNCIAVTDQMTISFSPSPNVNAGSNISVCSNNATANLNGSVSIAAGGIWSGGNGSFSPGNTSLGASYTPTPGEISNGSVTLTLTSTGNGTCNPVSDTVTITFTPAPTADAGPNQTTCANNPNAQLNGSVTVATGGSWSGGNGTFSPGSNVLNPVYTPSQGEINSGSVTLTLTTTGNGNCVSESDVMTISFDPAPTADAGSNISVCSNNADISLSGAVTAATGGTWSGGNGTFNPSANNLNATYTPTATEIAAGTLSLTLTTTGNGDCNAVSDDVVITFTPSPTANAGANQNICENNPNVSLNGSVSIATGGTWSGGAGTFTPDANALNALYTPTPGEVTSGSLTLTLTTTGNGNCNAVTDVMTINFTPSPTANAGNDQTVCENNPTATLNGNVTIATGGQWSGGLGNFSPSSTTLNAQYNPTQTEINNGSVTLTLTTTGNGNCTAVNDVVTIDFSPAPTANAGNNQSVCENNANVTLNGSVSIASGGTWSGGAGTFDPNANTLNAIYSPTAAEIESGGITLTLTTTGNGDCNAVSDDMNITFTPAPTLNAGPDKTTCANNASVSISASVIGATGVTWTGGTGTYDPSENAVNIIYFPSGAEIASGTVTLTATTTGNGTCLPVTDQVVITITPAVEADAGDDQILCSNNATISLDGSVVIATGGVWSGGLGSFSPNASTLNATYTPTSGEIASGNLTLTLTTTGNGQCNSTSDTVNFAFTPTPVVDAGANVSVCANDADVDLNGSVTVASGGIWSGGTGSFTPSNTSLTATYSPSAAEISAGTVQLTLTSTGNGNCVAVQDVMTITITPAPVVNAGSDQTVCANNVNVSLNGSVTVASGGTWSGGNGSFNPDANTLGATYTPTAGEIATGSVSLTLTSTGNGNCLAVSDVMNITITPAPIADAGPDQEVCSNNANINLNGSVTNATGGAWSGGLGSFNPSSTTLNATYSPTQTEINSGSVTLTLTTTGIGNCIAVTDVVTITFGPSPTADAGANQTVCANNEAVQLNGAVTVANGGAWSGGSGTFAPDANSLNAVYTPSQAEIDNGGVTLTLTTTGNGNCNAVTDNMNITITPAPVVNAGSDQTICANNPNIQLNGSVTVVTGGAWSGGLGTFSPNANTLNAVYTPTAEEIASGSLNLTLTSTGNGNCQAVSDVMNINFTPAPIAEAGPDQEVCSNNPAIGLAGVVTNANGGNWSGGSGSFVPNANNLNATYNPTASEINSGSIVLTLTTTGIGNCIAVTDSVTITFGPSPTANAGSNQAVCANNPNVTLNGLVTVATGGTWSGGNGTFTPDANTLNAIYTPTQTEIDSGGVVLTLTTIGNGNCLAVSDEMNITITPAPTANAGNNITVCENNATAQLNGSVTVATGGIWSGGDGTFSPNANTLNATYTPSGDEIASGSITLTLTTTGNGNCLAVTDVVTIMIPEAPVVDAGADQVLCANNSNAQLGGTIENAGGGQWSGGLGSFSPGSTNLNAVYTPTQTELNNGTVTLTLTSTANGTCLAESDVVTLTYTPAPTVNAGLNQTVCANNEDVQLNGSVTIATGGIWSGGNGTFNPNANTLNAIYTPSQSEIDNGGVTLTLTTTGNGDCIAVADEMDINITSAPTVNAGPDRFSCANNPNVNINGTVTGATGGVWSGGSGTFDPSENALSITYTPSASEIANGSVTLTLTTTGIGLCNPESDVMTVFIAPSPIVDAGEAVVVCANNNQVQLDGSVSFADGGVWSGGNGTFDPNPNTLNATYIPSSGEIANGGVNLTLTSTGNGNCLAVIDIVNITITPAPTANAGADVTVCADDAEIELNGQITVATGGIWSGGNGSFDPSPTDLNAVYTPTFAEISSGSVTLTLTTTGNGDCLAVSDAITITVQPVPFVNAGPDITVCANNSEVQLGGIFFNATSAVWSGGLGTFIPNNTDINAVYIPTQAEIITGGLTLTLTTVGTAFCAPRQDDLTINITPAPIVNAGLDVVSCANNPNAQLNGSVQNAGGGIWSGGNGTFLPGAGALNAVYVATAAETESGSVTLTLTSTGNGSCLPETDEVIVFFTDAPMVDAGTPITVCENNLEAQLNGSVVGATGGIWSGGSGSFNPGNTDLNAVYTPSSGEIAAGSVQLTLTSTGNGDCLPVADVVTITIDPAPEVFAGDDVLTCVTELEIPLNGQVIGATNTGEWSTTGTGFFVPSPTDLNATYHLSSADSAQGTIQIILASTNNGSCIGATDTLSITVLPPGIAEAGDDVTVCGNNAAVFLNGSIDGEATDGSWSTNGDGIFTPNSAALNATYLPGSGDIASGGAILTLTANSCDAATDELVITITPAPVVNAGNDVTVCVDDLEVTLNGSVSGASNTGIWTTSGTGTFQPNNTTLNATYIPSSADSVNQSVTLTLTATNIGNCNPVSDQMQINIFPAGFANAGPDIVICANQEEVQLNGIITGQASEAVWSTSGTGTFAPNNTTLDAVYLPSADDIDNGGVNLIFSTTNSCNFSSDFLNLTILPGPVANAGDDIAVCEAIFEFALNGSIEFAGGSVWSTSGTGTFGDPTSLNTTYFATEDDLESGIVVITLTTTDNGNCDPDTDQLTIIVTEGIVANAGEDQEVCELATSTQLQGVVSNGSVTGIWSTNTGGTFEPDATDLNATYVFSPTDYANGFVTLTLTSTNNGVCEPAVDIVQIAFGTAPFVDAGNDMEACADNPQIDISGFITGGASEGVWSTSGGGTFEPNNTALDATYIASEDDVNAGSVELTLTTTDHDLCDAGSASLTFTILPAPVVNAGDDMVVCDSDEQIVLNGTVTNAGGGIWSTDGDGSFLPDNTALNVLYIPGTLDTLSGNVTLTLTSTNNGLCEPVSDQMNVQIGVELIADAGDDITVCADDAEAALAGIIGGDATGGTWSTSGDGSFMPDANNLNATYIPGNNDLIIGSAQITLSTTGNSGCPAATDMLTITFEPVPVIFAGADIDVCGTSGDIDLNPTIENTSAIIWSTSGDGTFNPDPFTADATYSPSAADSLNGSVVLTIISNNEGVCSDVEDSLTITFSPEPLADAGEDFLHCNSDLNISLDGQISGADDAVWSTTGTGTFVPDANTLNAVYVASTIDSIIGSVTLTLTTITDSPCEDHSATVTVTFEPAPTANAGDDIVTCGNLKEVELNGIATNASEITWTTNGTGSFVPDNTTADATYILSEEDIENGGATLTLTTAPGEVCEAATDQLEIIISNPLVANFDVVNACVNQTTQFVDQTLVLGNEIVFWNWDFDNGQSSSEANPSVVYNETGTYNVTLTVIDADGCTDQITMMVNVAEVPLAGFSFTEVDDQGTFSFIDESEGANSWTWNFGDGTGSSNAQNPAYQYTEDGLYTIVQIATNEFGCSDSALVVVNYEGARIIPPKLPNAFSPNGDGENDVYYVLGGPFVQLDLRIFNSWGEVIFRSNDQAQGWDGTHRGQDVPVGVYVYTVNAITLDGVPYEKSGQITLIR